ncbi:common central domain of tyrosinase [Ancylostoma caninum]|uniref:Common central domain of tyrosinase n=1 Tax=Ancylostoma caninum TaxID=29170 RepID=A0A368FZ33_ANCCA|nr:common central domain of tyrosinase [Ancylostoma caninum]
MVEFEQLLCLVILLLSISPSNSQGICTRAPTPALRIICQQITNWDANTRNVRPTTRTSVSAPGPAGLAVGTFTVSAVASSTSPTTAYECMDIACLCGFFGGTGGSNCVLANGRTLTKALRKEYRVLTDDERQRYHTAMWTIKGNGDYDTIARIHSQFSTSPGAHSGPAFLPWHREFIKRLEIAIRRVDPTLALPYWDSTMDGALPSPADSVLWGNELMGTQDSTGAVRTGAFRNWPTVDGSRVFTRSIGTTGNLLQERDIATVVGSSDIRLLLAFTAPQAVCGLFSVAYRDMLVTTTATNDPIFFNHHSMIDLIWELWRLAQQVCGTTTFTKKQISSK